MWGCKWQLSLSHHSTGPNNFSLNPYNHIVRSPSVDCERAGALGLRSGGRVRAQLWARSNPTSHKAGGQGGLWSPLAPWAGSASVSLWAPGFPSRGAFAPLWAAVALLTEDMLMAA